MGPALLIIFMVALFPVGFFLTGALVSASWVWLFSAAPDQRHEGSGRLCLHA